MALSGRINGTCKGSNYSKYSLWIDWTVNSQSTANNKSNVTVTLKVQRNDGVKQSAYNLNSVNPVSLSVGGTVRVSKKIGIDTRNNQIVKLAAWTGDVPHSNDGTLSLSISGSFSISGTSTLTGGSVSGSAAINSISRYPNAVTACIAAQDGDQVNYNRGTVTVSWSGASGVITGYRIDRITTGHNDSTFMAWETIKTIISTATSGSITDTVPAAYMSGVQFKYRVTALNGSLVSPAKGSNILTVRGGVKAKSSGAWFNGTVWIDPARNKNWRRAKYIYAKSENSWKESI